MTIECQFSGKTYYFSGTGAPKLNVSSIVEVYCQSVPGRVGWKGQLIGDVRLVLGLAVSLLRL